MRGSCVAGVAPPGPQGRARERKGNSAPGSHWLFAGEALVAWCGWRDEHRTGLTG